MKRVVTVNLHGLSFNFDEDAYEELRAYLQRAGAQLAADPGRTEVLADLERSVAEKCQRYLSPQKDVVTLDEVRAVLAEIGVVESRADGWQASESTPFASAAGKRLYQVREGAMVSGICNGLSRYLGIDVTLLRVIFVVLAVGTSGGFVILYLVMMFLIPFDNDVEKVNDQSLPGFMFKFVTQMKRKLAGSN